MSISTLRPRTRRRGLTLAAGGVAVAVVAGLMIAGAPAQAADFTGANLALNHYASGSSGASPANATDGSTGTAWAPSASGWATLSVDLGSSTSVAGVRLKFGATPATSYQILTSPDANSWTSVYTTSSGSGATQDVVFTAPVSTRWLQVYFTQGTGYSVQEFEAYAGVNAGGGTTSSPGGGGGTNLALGHYASGSSGANPGYATDGSTATAWSPSASGWATLSVDLGATTTVASVVLRFGGTPATSYQILTSPNANGWTSVYSTSSGSGAVQTVTFTSPVSTRWLQVYFTQGTGYTLQEFEAYGSGGGSSSSPPSGNETIGGGTIANPAVGPGPSISVGGAAFTLVKNWDFGSTGDVTNINDLNGEFRYSMPDWNTWDLGGQYGSEALAPDSGHALTGQPVQDPNNPVRGFTTDSLKTYLVPLNGATTVQAQSHNVGSGAFYANYTLPNGGSLLNQDVLWETRVRYVTPAQFLFALWNAGNIWNNGAETDLVETFGWKHDDGATNYNGALWHSDVVGGTHNVEYFGSGGWGGAMSSVGITNFDPTQYHTWSLLYRKDNTYTAYVDGIAIQSGTINWTVGGTSGGTPINLHFFFDGGWGSTVIGADSHMNDPMPASQLAGKYYEYDYSRVYLRN